mmetsp:Transcript_36284/g.43830  ORF Transcript_36284/g.43830 Transcript_36284/m.43830 type:complete len:108 (+) Transcript_36284:126-449(+)|eukprot:CAMPEP_0197848040 /NCGR_PEP_ID=MMETSP1438-20131217/7892_1 /TAXON_ID=1461541 /ORGANISM="Pterosperma sp., Strain CCMP1384" /LENGTH=107 /DNA_ID=CAMNT_0043460167 /DNA_START=123 /DNA_END=446 /DNA_ORIENTATION=-
MSDDFTAGAYQGDPLVPHANTFNYTLGLAGVIGGTVLQKFTPFFTVKHQYAPDYVLAVAEESYRKKCIRQGKEFKEGKEFKPLEKQRWERIPVEILDENVYEDQQHK